MDVVVSDTSPLRALAHLGLNELLAQLFSHVWVPPAVVDELEHPIRKFRSVQVSTFAGLGVRAPANLAHVLDLRWQLKAGESEAIALAIELGLTTVIMDERDGRQVASQLGLECIGVIGLLTNANKRGLVGPVRPLVERLRSELRFFVSDQLMNRLPPR